MSRRFPLFLKKRGRRRTGSPVLARVGESLYHAMFVAMGAIGIWWTLTDVLLPEWRLAAEAEGFRKTQARVSGARVVTRPGLAEPEYCPELELEIASAEGEPVRVWTRHGVGRDTPSRLEAESALERYALGETRVCWVDPNNPQRVLLSVRKRWWPWLVLSIPASLLIAGAFGLVRTLVSSRSSPERRSALITQGLDLSQLEAGAPRPTVASGLPPVESLDESPGVRRAYRLPMDSSDGWRIAGMATLCLVWNLLVALFAYQLASEYLSVGWRIALAGLVGAPLAWVGARLMLPVWREAPGVSGADATRIELDGFPLRVGERMGATLMQSGPMRVRSLTVWLVCEEIATYRQGTDARTAVAEVSRDALLGERRFEIDLEEPWSRDFTIELPSGSTPSFVSPNNEVRWSLEVRVEPFNRNDVRRRFPLVVYPALAGVAAVETTPARDPVVA